MIRQVAVIGRMAARWPEERLGFDVYAMAETFRRNDRRQILILLEQIQRDDSRIDRARHH